MLWAFLTSQLERYTINDSARDCILVYGLFLQNMVTYWYKKDLAGGQTTQLRGKEIKEVTSSGQSFKEPGTRNFPQ